MEQPSPRYCALIPTLDNAFTIERVVTEVGRFLPDIVVVDDGSNTMTRRVVARLAEEGKVVAVHRESNGGKGAAVKDGMRAAADRGYSHVLQVDADGQHDIDRAGDFLLASAQNPQALILGYPLFGDDAPLARVRGRKLTQYCVDIEAGRGVIKDAMVGFRVYPLKAALDLGRTTNRMDFDIEIAVRLAWAEVPIINLPVGVRYLQKEEGGVSNFRPLADNARISWLHTRLITHSIFRRVFRLPPFRG